MWLPLTSLTLCFAPVPPASERIRPTHGPLALTTLRARTVKRSPDTRSARTAVQLEPRRRERDARGAGADLRPPGVRIAGVQYHQPRILHPAVRVLEGPAIAALQRAPARVPAEVDARARRQQAAPAEVVVEKEAQTDHPPGAQPGVMREHEAHRPDDVRGVAQQHRALAQGVAHKSEVAVLQVAKPAVDQLGAGRRGVRGQIVLLAQQHVEAAPRRVPGDAGAVDAAADDEQVDRARRRTPHTHLNTAIP